jgi:hypothetical protein
MTCPGCGSDNWVVELRTGADGGPAGLQNKCCQCGHSWRPEGAGNVAPRIEQGQPASIRRAPPQPTAQKPQRRVTAKSVVSDAKQELRRLDKEIARLEKLKRQRAELARLLEAAKGAPSTVVELKRASHTR